MGFDSPVGFVRPKKSNFQAVGRIGVGQPKVGVGRVGLAGFACSANLNLYVLTVAGGVGGIGLTDPASSAF